MRITKTMLICGWMACGAALLPVPASAADTPGAATTQRLIVSGASGKLGELVVQELLKRGMPASALILVSRTPEKLSAYAAQGAATRFGDVDQPDSLAAAYAGGTRMLMISLGFGQGAAPRPPRHKLAFDAAVKAGVKRIVYTSFLGADQGGNMLAEDHKRSEQYLMASGAQWVSLRNGFYADGLLRTALDMARTGKATAAPHEPKSAPVTREDCAAAAAGALLADAAVENRGYDITGPALIDTRDVARMVGEMIGKPITVSELAPAATRPAGPPAFGPTPPIVSDAVARLAGRPATTLRELLEAHKAELVAAANGQVPASLPP